MAMGSERIPLYQQVKQYIRELIDGGAGEGNRRLPSENELVDMLKVSRMTVNRALRELVKEGYVERISGVGTFIADKRLESHPLTIQNIAAEIDDRGLVHQSKVITIEEVRAAAGIALMFNIAAGSRLFHSIILHSESGVPIQYEVRYVYPAFAPDFINVDFSKTTTNEYLMSVSRAIDEVEQNIRAEIPTKELAQLLKMSPGEPCLVLFRRTWVGKRVVTKSTLYHPASRFQFGSRYKP